MHYKRCTYCAIHSPFAGYHHSPFAGRHHRHDVLPLSDLRYDWLLDDDDDGDAGGEGAESLDRLVVEPTLYVGDRGGLACDGFRTKIP